jgi:regulator of replication initiation timing
MQKEKENLEKIHAEATALLQAQVESGKKQVLDLIEKSQELEVELEKLRKKNSSKYHIFFNRQH